MQYLPSAAHSQVTDKSPEAYLDIGAAEVDEAAGYLGGDKTNAWLDPGIEGGYQTQVSGNQCTNAIASSLQACPDDTSLIVKAVNEPGNDASTRRQLVAPPPAEEAEEKPMLDPSQVQSKIMSVRNLQWARRTGCACCCGYRCCALVGCDSCCIAGRRACDEGWCGGCCSRRYTMWPPSFLTIVGVLFGLSIPVA